MSNTNELYDTLNDLWENFQENHRKFSEKHNKAAAQRARKSLGEIKKLVTGYRKNSVSESKS
jgi:predicted metalloprotease with PDZ domain